MASLSPLDEARRREKLTQAEWRRRRAEVARLIAAGEEAAARKLLAEVGAEPPAEFESDSAAETVAAPITAGAVQLPKTSGGASSKERTQPAVRRPHKASGEPQGDIQRRGLSTPAVAKTSAAKAPATQASAAKPVAEKPAAAKRPAAKHTAKGRPVPKRRGAKLRRHRTWLEWFRSRPPWATSLAAHGALLTLFAMLTFATFGEPGFCLTASLDDNDAWNELPAEVTLADLQVEADSEFASPNEAAIDLAADVELASLVEPVDLTAVSTLGDVLAVSAESLMAAVPAQGEAEGSGESGGDKSEGGVPQGAAGKVSFFGAEAEAQCVVFVVDNSGSMQDGRMQVTLMELADSIRGLSESQDFYIVFFSDQAYPMLYPNNVLEPLRATPENKKTVMKWLRTVEMCLGGRLLDAMEFASQLKPGVVFLLTDGDIRSSRTVERMTTKDAWGFPIHVLGMGARTPQHGQILQAIADGSGGTARPVNVAPDIIRRARARPIPYHNTPGMVWGSAVQKWE